MTESRADEYATSDWTKPGAYPVAPGVFRIPLPLPHDALRAVNAYAVVSGGGEVAVITPAGPSLKAKRCSNALSESSTATSARSPAST